MQVFRIETDALSKRREARVRLLSWGTVVSLLVIAALLFVLRLSGLLESDSTFLWLAMLALLGGVIGAVVFACREALRSAERQMVFTLDENGIIRKREGWPDLKITFPEMDTLREELRWLVIYGGAPRKKIAVPKDVADYEAIRAELVRRHPLSARAEIPLSSIALPIISVLSWAAVVWFRDARIAIPAGVVALASLAIGSRRLWTLLHRGPKRLLMWLCLSSIWFSAILLLYIRAVRR